MSYLESVVKPVKRRSFGLSINRRGCYANGRVVHTRRRMRQVQRPTFVKYMIESCGYVQSGHVVVLRPRKRPESMSKNRPRVARRWQPLRKKQVETYNIRRLHAGLFIVDEIHETRTPRNGPWRFIGQMKDDRPHLWFWVVGMSGTVIHSNA